MTDNLDDSYLLFETMADLSEKYWCAGWLSGLEYTLWEQITPGNQIAYILNENEISKLRHLSEKCKGWWFWDDDSTDPLGADYCVKFIDLQSWQDKYNNSDYFKQIKK